jgi:phospholipid/cholesterol/gamma-HCH transport system substrate-binding protein
VKTRPSYFSDYLIALAVIASTVVLLGALAMTLTGFRLSKSTRVLHLDFPDVAGIHQHSQLRYAGAPAGSVVSVRHLTAEERLRSVNSANAVRVTVGIDDGVPPIPADVTAALGADTLLSEKFIGLSAGTAGGPSLPNGAVIQGIAQPTFDDLVRGGADVFATLNKMMPGVKARMDELLPKLAAISDAGGKVAEDAKALFAKATDLMDKLVALSKAGNELLTGDAKKLLGSANEAAEDAKVLMSSANKLLKEHEADLDKVLTDLPEVLDHADALLGRTQGMLTSNEKELSATIRDLRAVMQDMRVVAVHAKKLTATLAGGHPSRLVWVKDDEPQPTEAEILQGKSKPAPPPAAPERTVRRMSPVKR